MNSQKAAEKLGFFRALLLRGRSFAADNISRERKALAAFWFAAKPRVDVARTFRPAAHGGAEVFLPDSIANAYNHDSLLMRPYAVNAN